MKYHRPVKFSTTYRFLASLLSLSILIGISIPTGLHAMPENLCEDIQDMHHPTPSPSLSEHGEQCPMNGPASADLPIGKFHYSLNDLGLDCACSLEDTPLKTEASVFQKGKTQIFVLVKILTENHTPNHEFDTNSYLVTDSYSPPPIYIVNESFLI